MALQPQTQLTLALQCESLGVQAAAQDHRPEQHPAQLRLDRALDVGMLTQLTGRSDQLYRVHLNRLHRVGVYSPNRGVCGECGNAQGPGVLGARSLIV